MEFLTFLECTHKAQAQTAPLPEYLIALDPGETTGYACFHYGKLIRHEQLPTHRIRMSVKLLEGSIPIGTSAVVYEDYKVYGWKTESHAWESLHTPKLIGSIETVCTQRKIPTFTQMAQQAKQFVTDAKLREWGLYKVGERHTRDAIRHGCYFLLFNLHKQLNTEGIPKTVIIPES